MANSLVQTLIQQLLKSLGLKRKIAALLQTVAAVAATVPVLVPFAASISIFASWLGVTGVTHAAFAGTLKTNVLASIAAFLGALSLAAKTVPQLKPYAQLIQELTTIISIFVSGTVVQQAID